MKIDKIKDILKVESNFQLFIVFLVFAITGSATLFLSEILFSFLNLDDQNLGIFYLFLRILIIFPVYQILLIIIGTVFGEFKYFWKFEKKFLKKIGINLK